MSLGDGSQSQQIEPLSSQYELLMKKYSESQKEPCRPVAEDMMKVGYMVKRFPTGSQYQGSCDVLGMSGAGIYEMPNGVIYEGEFDDGMFDGEGELLYPDGEVLKGVFAQGLMVERTLIFADGLYYSDVDWMYCRAPDRRFTIEYKDGVQPATESYMTAELPIRDIPPGFYDTGDGFYNPDTKIVYRSDDITAILRAPSEREQNWIVDNCRMAPQEQIGPRQDLFEEWTEPEPEPSSPPLPAAMSRATEYMFNPAKSMMFFEDEERESMTDYDKWLRRYKLSTVGRSRTTLGNPSMYEMRSRDS